MNTFIFGARDTLLDNANVGLRISGFANIAPDYVAHLAAMTIRKPRPVSSIRVKKSMGITQFALCFSEFVFVSLLSLEEGLARTLRCEFVGDNSNKRTFETEQLV